MSESNRFLSEIKEELLRCKICFEQYSEPKTLTCLHTFCLVCLRKHQEAEYDRSYKYATLYMESITCPLCRKRTEMPVGGLTRLPDNFVVANLRELVRKEDEATGYHFCHICHLSKGEKSEAARRCLDCQKCLCNACAAAHKNNKLAENHQIVAIDSSSRFLQCEAHKGEQVKYYCATCDQNICVICTFEEHATHDVMQFSERLVQCREETSQQLSEAKVRIEVTTNGLERLRLMRGDHASFLLQIQLAAEGYRERISVSEAAMIARLHEAYGAPLLELFSREDTLNAALVSLREERRVLELLCERRPEMFMIRSESTANLTASIAACAVEVPFLPRAVTERLVGDLSAATFLGDLEETSSDSSMSEYEFPSHISGVLLSEIGTNTVEEDYNAISTQTDTPVVPEPVQCITCSSQATVAMDTHFSTMFSHVGVSDRSTVTVVQQTCDAAIGTEETSSKAAETNTAKCVTQSHATTMDSFVSTANAQTQDIRPCVSFGMMTDDLSKVFVTRGTCTEIAAHILSISSEKMPPRDLADDSSTNQTSREHVMAMAQAMEKRAMDRRATTRAARDRRMSISDRVILPSPVSPLQPNRIKVLPQHTTSSPTSKDSNDDDNEVTPKIKRRAPVKPRASPPRSAESGKSQSVSSSSPTPQTTLTATTKTPINENTRTIVKISEENLAGFPGQRPLYKSMVTISEENLFSSSSRSAFDDYSPSRQPYNISTLPHIRRAEFDVDDDTFETKRTKGRLYRPAAVRVESVKDRPQPMNIRAWKSMDSLAPDMQSGDRERTSTTSEYQPKPGDLVDITDSDSTLRPSPPSDEKGNIFGFFRMKARRHKRSKRPTILRTQNI